MPFTESEITLNFPDNNYFCFENCAAHQEISGFGIKDMDAGWFDVDKKILYLIELKDFSNSSAISNEEDEDKSLLGRSKNLVKKAADSIAMINAILLNTNWGQKLQSNLPCTFDRSYEVWLISVIHINQNENQTNNVSLLNTKFTSLFNGYRKIFGNVNYAAVLSHEQAKTKFPQFIL